LHDEKQFVLVFVVMPHELAQKLDELDLVPIDLSDNLRLPVLTKEIELCGQIDVFHTSRTTVLQNLWGTVQNPFFGMPAAAQSVTRGCRLGNRRYIPPIPQVPPDFIRQERFLLVTQ
jgi:hypothetical protein